MKIEAWGVIISLGATYKVEDQNRLYLFPGTWVKRVEQKKLKSYAKVKKQIYLVVKPSLDVDSLL